MGAFLFEVILIFNKKNVEIFLIDKNYLKFKINIKIDQSILK